MLMPPYAYYAMMFIIFAPMLRYAYALITLMRRHISLSPSRVDIHAWLRRHADAMPSA